MCKHGGLLITFLYGEHRALVTDADCDSWKCEECAEKLKSRWQMRAEIGARAFLLAGVRVDFITITSHERLKTFEACNAAWGDAWNKLHARLKRKADVCEYMLIPERHKDGRMHVHAIWTFGVSRRWLKDNARACGLGYQADVKPCEDVWRVTRYVTKYISKSLGGDAPPRFRRVRVSSGWADVPEPESDASAYDWQYIGGNGALQAAYEECERARLSMIDLRTGEIFDDVDLGTIVYA